MLAAPPVRCKHIGQSSQFNEATMGREKDMAEGAKKEELSPEQMGTASGGIGEKQSFMVIKDGEGTFGPFETEEEAQQKAKELGTGWNVVPVWGF